LAILPDLRTRAGRVAESTAGLASASADAAAPRLRRIAGRTRSRHLFVVDLIGLIIAGLVALELWMLAAPFERDMGSYLWVVGIVVATRTAVAVVLGLYRHSWRHASVADMGRIITCALVGSAVALTIILVAVGLRPPSIDHAPAAIYWVSELALALVVLATPRFLIRSVFEMRPRRGESQADASRPTLLFGAGWAGVMIARSAQRDSSSPVLPVGFLDDDADLKGRQVAGLPVFGGIDSMARAIRLTGATSLLITMPRASGQTVRAVLETARRFDLQVRTVPPVTDLLDGSLDASRIRRVRVEDLLRREPATAHPDDVAEVFRGRPVLITGAAGSIGSELARQLLALGPSSIALVDRAESDLYLVQRDLEERAARSAQGLPSDVTISAHLADVTDRHAMRRLMRSVRPSVVLHAAAVKHVPMLEEHATVAVRTNIGGTLAVVDAASEAGVEHFVLVSTDKAVWPSSVMGATKRVAEMIVADAARRLGLAYISVRFGNVLGSQGSVVPIFQDQLERGQAITLTDPRMTRYFMTIPEASWLIIDAAAIADDGGLYLLDMGQPVRIIDVARDLIRLSGRDPDSVSIDVVGLRSGEKLHEDLFYSEESASPTSVPKVLRARSIPPPERLRDDILDLLALATGEREAELAETLHAYVRESVRLDEDRWLDGAEGPAPRSDPKELVAIKVESDPPEASNGNGHNGNGHASDDHDRALDGASNEGAVPRASEPVATVDGGEPPETPGPPA